jgi:hypothetical protein
VIAEGRLLLNAWTGVAAVDSRSGRLLFHTDLSALGTRSTPDGRQMVTTSQPAPGPGGTAVVGVYAHDESLHVVTLDGAGRVAGSQESGREDGGDQRPRLKIVGGPEIHLGMAAPIVLGDGHLFTWFTHLQRQFRFTERRTAAGRLRWSVDEWSDGIYGEGVLCRSNRAPGANSLVMRHTDGGGAHWRRAYRDLVRFPREVDGWVAGVASDSRGRDVLQLRDPSGELETTLEPEELLDLVLVALVRDVLLAVDLSARWLERWARSVWSGRPPGLDYAQRQALIAERRLQLPSRLEVLDPADGTTRWARDVRGEVVSVASGDGVLGLVVAEEDGHGSIQTVDRSGQLLGQVPFLGPPGGAHSWGLIWLPASAWPSLIAVDGERLLWADRSRLVCAPVDEPGRQLWELLLPARCDQGGHVQPGRGFSTRDVAVGEEAIYLRDGDWDPQFPGVPPRGGTGWGISDGT